MAPSYTIPALARSFEVIECISRRSDGVTFTDLVESLQAPKSSIFRILRTLEAASWLERKDDRYMLGDMLIHYGLTTLSRRTIADIARPILENLSNETGESSHLAVPSGRESMILEVCESRRHIITVSGAGNRLPMYCTSHGKVFLAYIIGDDVDDFYAGEPLVPRTSRTITEIGRLQRELRSIRSDGYAQDRQEYHENVWCCAAPVYGRSGECIGAVGITGTTITCTPDRLEGLCRQVKDAAAEVSRRMGRSTNGEAPGIPAGDEPGFRFPDESRGDDTENPSEFRINTERHIKKTI